MRKTLFRFHCLNLSTCLPLYPGIGTPPHSNFRFLLLSAQWHANDCRNYKSTLAGPNVKVSCRQNRTYNAPDLLWSLKYCESRAWNCKSHNVPESTGKRVTSTTWQIVLSPWAPSSQMGLFQLFLRWYLLWKWHHDHTRCKELFSFPVETNFSLPL